MDKNRVNYISFINVLAATAVVIMHANSSFWSCSPTEPYWGVANVIESVCFCAVPLFFMLTGATLIDYPKRYSTKDFFKKRFVKTVIPFLFWSVFGMCWASRKVLWAMITGAPNQGLDWTFETVFKGIFNTRFVQIYWFFIPLFCIYLAIPFFASIAEERRIKIFTYAIAVGLALNYLQPFVFGLIKEYTGVAYSTNLTFFISHQYLMYPLIGYVLHKTELKLKYRLVIYALALAGLLAFLIGTYVRSRAAGAPDGLYRGYYGLPCALYASGVYLFLKNAAQRIKSEKVNRFFAYFQSYTFPIYLIHRFYLDVFEENLHFIHIQKASIIYVIGATVLALTLSVLTTMLLRKIPVLRRVVP